jgi:hypothetical protein
MFGIGQEMRCCIVETAKIDTESVAGVFLGLRVLRYALTCAGSTHLSRSIRTVSSTNLRRSWDACEGLPIASLRAHLVSSTLSLKALL